MFKVVGKFYGGDEQHVFSERFENLREAIDVAIEVLSGDYDTSGETPFDFVEVRRGSRVVKHINDAWLWGVA
jgi:hypothetical protein